MMRTSHKTKAMQEFCG